ncbi:hypothetical protein ABIA06_006279 [Bradyrhizobium yuanmingense]|uniref:UrcA family protein n=1 Tax=Bradyrhizobium yuanmingense TaxID=108015 RepID=A0ABV4GFN9_9BRAD
MTTEGPWKAAAASLLLLLPFAGHAQTASQNPSRLTLQRPAEQSGSIVVRDALGRPCLDVEAAARAHAANPKVFDHVVSIKNNCPRLVKVTVCYANSDRCMDTTLASYARSDVILGTMTGIRLFKYSMRQR